VARVDPAEHGDQRLVARRLKNQVLDRLVRGIDGDLELDELGSQSRAGLVQLAYVVLLVVLGRAVVRGDERIQLREPMDHPVLQLERTGKVDQGDIRGYDLLLAYRTLLFLPLTALERAAPALSSSHTDSTWAGSFFLAAQTAPA
jgi:hypothetical protein